MEKNNKITEELKILKKILNNPQHKCFYTVKNVINEYKKIFLYEAYLSYDYLTNKKTWKIIKKSHSIIDNVDLNIIEHSGKNEYDIFVSLYYTDKNVFIKKKMEMEETLYNLLNENLKKNENEIIKFKKSLKKEFKEILRIKKIKHLK